MSKFWLISVFLLLANQSPTTRSQNGEYEEVPEDDEVANCPAECQCYTFGGFESVNVNCTLNSPFMPLSYPTFTETLQLTCTWPHHLEPRENMFALVGLRNSLRELIIDGCFNLQQASLSGVFNGLDQYLIFITLHGNRIPSLRPGVFNNHNLTGLYLANNSIATIDSGTFSNMGGLVSINLQDNQLSAVDVSAFDSLINDVYFSGNPLVCDCRLVGVWQRYINSRNRDLVCPDVNDLGNRTWRELNEAVLRQHGDCPETTTSTSSDTTTSRPANTSSTTTAPILPSNNPTNPIGGGTGTVPDDTEESSNFSLYLVILLAILIALFACAFFLLQLGSYIASTEEAGSRRSVRVDSVRKQPPSFLEKKSEVECPQVISVPREEPSKVEAPKKLPPEKAAIVRSKDPEQKLEEPVKIEVQPKEEPDKAEGSKEISSLETPTVRSN